MEILKFANKEMLWLLWIIPVLILFFIVNMVRKKKSKKKFASDEMSRFLFPEASNARIRLKFILLMLSLIFIIIALAGPRVGSQLKEVEKKGREFIIALDVSRSMLAEDIKPNRIEMAKQSLNRLIRNMEDDKIGLIVFAGDAYIQIPVTNDYGAARLFLNSVNTNIVSKQGTAIGSAIELALRSFTPGNDDGEVAQDESRAIIIITDGENHEEGVFEAAEKAAEKDIKVHTIGLGDPKGVPIPVNYGSNNYLKDQKGNVVVSKLDETTLKKIASVSGGFYVRADRSGRALNQLVTKLEELEQEEYTAKVFADYEERYQYFLGFGLLLLFIEFLIMEKKNKWLKKIKIFDQ